MVSFSPTAVECDQGLRGCRTARQLHPRGGRAQRHPWGREPADPPARRLARRSAFSCAPAVTPCRRGPGTDLLAEAGPALDRLASCCLGGSQNGAQARGSLHVSALPTFAMRWLIPAPPRISARSSRRWNYAIVTASTPAEQFRMDVDVVISGPSRQPGWVGNTVSRRSALAGVEPRPDEKMPAADTGRSRAAHAASCRDAARSVAAMAGRRQCPRSKAGARSGLRAFLLCDPGGTRGAWRGHGPRGARQR